MQERHIDTADGLVALCQQLAGSEWLALDTEFMREKTYYPQLCLWQVSNGEIAASIDPLAIDDLEPFRALLFDPQVVKVFHAASQDLEIVLLDWGAIPTPLFDTQLAAAICGLGDQLGYARLVEALLNIQLPKDQSRTDWSRRPLDEAQLRYALDDVIHLGDVYLKLRQQLKANGREHWLDAEHAELADPNRYRIDPRTAWQRVKQRQRLRGAQLAVLRELAAWREQRAIDSDKPRRWIMSDDALLEIARRQPRDQTALEKVRGVETGVARKQGDALLAAIEAGRSLPQEQWPVDKPKRPKLKLQQEAQVDLLQCALRLIGQREGVTPSAIATRRDLELLLLDDKESLLLHGWRRAVAGETLLQVRDGSLLPQWEHGQLVLRPS